MAEATKYIAYISLDFLDFVEVANGWQGEPKKMQKFVDKMKKDINDFIKSGNDAALKSWKWTDNDGREHYAIELLPVRVSDEEALFVSEEQWQALKQAAAPHTGQSVKSV